MKHQKNGGVFVFLNIGKITGNYLFFSLQIRDRTNKVSLKVVARGEDDLQDTHTTVDGRNPQQPPGMVLKPSK